MEDRNDPNPKVMMEVRVPNPDREADPAVNYYMPVTVEAEVLTIHLNTGMMRVRYQWDGKTESGNFSNEPFFEQYSIRKKG